MTTCSSVSIVNFEHVITVWEYSSTVNNIKRYDDRDVQQISTWLLKYHAFSTYNRK